MRFSSLIKKVQPIDEPGFPAYTELNGGDIVLEYEEYEQFNDDELDELDDEEYAEFDALVEYLSSLPRAEALVLNPKRLMMLRFCFESIKRVLKNSGCKATVICKQSDLEPTMGYVNVESSEISIENMEWFARAAEFASNTEVYPLAANKVRMTFTFNGLLVSANAL